MKDKREIGEREAMLAMMTTGCRRTHRVEKESDRIVWLSVYLQFRSNKTKQIDDRYQSISIIGITSPSKHQHQR